jgi:hypothetical protein
MRVSRIAGIVAAAGCMTYGFSGTALAAGGATSPDAGAVSLAPTDCLSDTFCLFTGTSYTGSMLGFFPTVGARFQLSAAGFNDLDRSWINNTALPVRVYNDWTNGDVSGVYFNAPPHTAGATISSTYSGKGSGVAMYS